MPRYIDADKLITKIRQKECSAFCSGKYPDYVCEVNDRLTEIRNAPTVDTATVIQGGWISVKDRMPEKRDWLYLVMLEGDRYSLMRYGCDHGKWIWYGFAWRDQVTHWMPLPEPPKEVQDDESIQN